MSCGGEDFIKVSADHKLICLADGVGSWKKKKGIDAGEYSATLCTNFIRLYENQMGLFSDEKILDAKEKAPIPNLVEMLVDSIQQTKCRGSCTFTAVYMYAEKS